MMAFFAQHCGSSAVRKRLKAATRSGMRAEGVALDQGGGFGDVVAAVVGEGFAEWGFFALSGKGGELLVEGGTFAHG
jgi:hypothetical protein